MVPQRAMTRIIGEVGRRDPVAGSTLRPRWSPTRRPRAITGPVMLWLGMGSRTAGRSLRALISHSS